MHKFKKIYILIAISITIFALMSIGIVALELNKTKVDNLAKAAVIPPVSVKVLTYNLGGFDNWTLAKQTDVENFLYTQNADIVFLQELRTKDPNNRPSIYLQKVINNLIARSVNYNYWYVDRLPAYNGTQGFIGQAILSKYALPAADRLVTVVNPGYPDVGIIKDYLMQQKVNINNQDIYLFNYHPQPGRSCNANVYNYMLSVVKAVKAYPIIFGGDFNMTRACTPVYVDLTSFLVDTCKPDTTIICPTTNTVTDQIDYIFYSNQILFSSSISTQVLNTITISDHYPVISTLVIAGSTSSSQINSHISSSISNPVILPDISQSSRSSVSNSHISSNISSNNSTIFVSSSISSASSDNPIAKYDINKSDGAKRIDISDFAVFIINYKKINVCGNIADFNGDCKVDISDFAMFIVYYKKSY